jgi:hypothetical protein
MYVRLKPYDPKNGCVKRRFHYKDMLYAISNDTGQPIWYKMNDPKLIAELKEMRQIESSQMSPPLFDILDEATYQKVQEEETNLRLVELGLMSATSTRPNVEAPVVDRSAEEAGREAAVPSPAIDAPTPLAPEPVVPDPVEKADLEASDDEEDNEDVAVDVDEEEDDEDKEEAVDEAPAPRRPRRQR